MRELTHLSLFSGIGGLDLAAEWAGFKTVGQCEWADYPTKVLERHWPDVERWRDIRTLTKESFYERTGLHTVDIISGGFPCQPFSVAGKQRGKEDDRFLWPEMARVIAELRPTWVIGENVAGIVNLALDDVLFDLEGKGYATRTFLIPACGVGAPHQRYRTAIVARNTNGRNRNKGEKREMEERKDTKPTGICRNVSNSDSTGCQKLNSSIIPDQPRFSCGGSNETNVCNSTSQGFQDWSGKQMEQSCPEQKFKRSGGRYENHVPNTDNRKYVRQQPCPGQTIRSSGGEAEHGSWEWWAVEPELGRVANGIPNRVDRLRCLGNAVVPQQFYPITQAIADIERLN